MNGVVTELGYLGFEVSDLVRWEHFATDVLGLMCVPGPHPNTRLLRMDDHRYRFLLREGPADDCVFAGWQTADMASVEAFGDHLDEHGVSRTWATDEELALRRVERMLHFRDPAGNRQEIYCGPALATDRFTSSKVASGFVTRGEGLGHIVYSSSTYDETLQFARNVLGLGVSDQIRIVLGSGMKFEVSFFHANSRHHSFAIAPQPPFPGPKKRMHHFMIEVNSVEDVGFARDRCLAMGQSVLMDIGQHPNDRMISFYGETPSGFLVEFGTGGVKVDRDTWHFATYDKLSEWGHRPNGEVVRKKAAVESDRGRKAAAAVIEGNAEVASASGSWKVVIKTPMGDNAVIFEFQEKASDLTGSIKGATETTQIYEGKIDGNTLVWRSKVSRPLPMDLEFTATFEGNTIVGGAKSPFGTAPFSGSRA